MSQGPHPRKYGVETTIDFELYEVDGVDLRTDWTPAQSDCEVMKDEGASTMCTNTATDEGSTYSIVLTATEMQAARLVLKVVDAATKVFLDKVIIIETYGNASAMHAFDLDTALQTVDLTHIMGTILTEGGAGRLAAAFIKLLDVVTPVLVASDVMRGTDGANTTVPDAAGTAPTAVENRQEMDSNSTRLDANVSSRAPSGEYDTQLDANMSTRAPASEYDTEMARITANVALASVCTEARLAELDAGNLPTDIAAIPTAIQNRQEMDSNSTELGKIGTIPALDGAGQTIGAAIGKLADDNGGADFDAGTDSLQEIRDRGDAAWLTGAGGDATEAKQDIIIADVTGINGDVMRGTDGANTTVPDAAGTAATPANVATALTDIHLDHIFATAYDPAAKPGAADALLNELVEDDGGISRYTANSLEEAPSGAGLTATQDANLTFIKEVTEGDATIDKSGTPWDLVIKKKSTATELIRKELKDTDGNAVTGITTVIGQQVEP